jgi:hypothetical protein
MAAAAEDAQGAVAELRGALVRIVRTSTEEVDRRVHPRTPLDRGAMLELAGQRQAAVNLMDLSEGGAAIELRDGSATTGATGRLVLDSAVLPVRVIAAEGRRVGLAFVSPAEGALATVRRVMREAGIARAA